MPLLHTRTIRIAIVLGVVGIAALFSGALRSPDSAGDPNADTLRPLTQRPRDGQSELSESEHAESRTRQSSIAEVLEMATVAKQFLADHLHDYTARFVKQEVDSSGTVGGSTEMLIKVQTQFRDGTQSAPMRVYLRFTTPEAVCGREVIWCEDLYDGQLVVHEAGLLGMITLRLDPNGMLAMRGQRYPISQIGLVRLVDKLIERGRKELDNPDIQVMITEGFLYDGLSTQSIQVRRLRRAEQIGGDDDFSLAEIIVDPQRKLVLSYRSFGWPTSEESQTGSLQESYNYFDVQTNVGLDQQDFDPANPEYQFP